MSKKPRKRITKRKDRSAERRRMVYVPLGKLHLWEQNPRRNDETAKRLAEAFRAHGMNAPLVAQPDGRILVGNARYKGAGLAGMTHVPVIYVDFPTDRQARAYALADNRLQELSEWDEDMLVDALKDVEGVDVAGFTQLEIDGVREGWEISQTDETKDTSFATQTFAEIAEAFLVNHPAKKKEEYWAWVILPGRKEMELVCDKFSRGKTGRELDFKKVAKAFGIPIGKACSTCKTTGRDKTIATNNRACKCCGGSGYLTISGKKSIRRREG